VKFDQLINELEAEKTRLQKELSQYQSKNIELETNAKDYKDLKDYLDNEKAQILKKAKAEALEIVAQANRRVEATIREIKETQADKAATKAVREELKTFEKELAPEKPKKPQKSVVTLIGGEINIGSKVKIEGQEAIGEVVNIKGKTAEVMIGELKSKIKLDRLERVTTKEFKEKKKKASSMTGISFNDKAASFSSNIDLRGKRAEIALGEVDYFLDQAILLGQKQLRIVHGKGYGILRDLIRNHLRGNRMISGVADEHIERGGSGVTVVNLK
jgi:DNA mismatch repair protein MutS2